MGLASTVASAVATAFEQVGDLKTTVTYVAKTVGGFNVPDDTFVDTELSTVVDVVEVAPTERELEWFPATDITTKKLLIRAADLLNVAPTLRDRVTINGVSYDVVRTKSVPGNALHIVWVQGP